MVRRPRPKRGVIILIVLSLLVLFVLLVVTFAIVAGQFRRAAMAYARQETLGVNPPKDLDKAFYQLLRDTRGRNSVVRFHSLLRDFYGEDGFSGRLAPGYHQSLMNDSSPTVPFPQPPTAQVLPGTSLTRAGQYSGGQFFDLLAYVPQNGTLSLTSTDGQPYTISQIPGYYNGCVLTVTSGTAQGVSMRIIGYAYLSGIPVFRVLAPKGDGGQQITPAALGGRTGVGFVVNGRPFSGTGFGYQTPAAIANPTRLDATIMTTSATNSVAVAATLAPNHAGQPVMSSAMQTGFQTLLGGGTDEGYDAPDNQNLATGLVMAGATNSAAIIPSFHRPGLVNYWINETSLGYWAADDDFKRHVLMRPVEVNFDGSNPYFDPVTVPGTPSWYTTGPWDVDNDGDGIADSIWVDFGLPVQTAADGRKYKPLFAVLCIDLDGRLNVNAHGRLAVFPNPLPVGLAGGIMTQPPPPPPGAYPALPKGLGYGPPEIDLGSGLFGLMSDRYGPDGRPGRPGLDLLARLKFFEEPENYFRSDPVIGTGPRSSYSMPSDLRAELAFGLNNYGQPVFEQMPVGLAETRGDSHYEMNLVEPDGSDRPFTESDLEQVLRRYDYDVAMLSDRLSNYFTNLTSSASEDARIMTTTSFDAPVPGMTVPGELAEAVRNAQQNQTAITPFNPLYKGNHLKSAASFLDLLAVRLLRGGVTTANLSAELEKMVSPDVRMGLRMDLNRPIGNGRDRIGAGANGVCDEFGEQLGEQVYNDVGASRGEYQQVPMWHANGADVNSDGTPPYGAPPDPNMVLDNILARQLLARHLYVMMMTLIDHGSVGTPDPTQDADGKTIADHVAQWAVNVVDFRDADSVMTAFEYDRNPFNGWNVDGDLTPPAEAERGVVWGAERPELLMTEAIAWHDRRTEDLSAGGGHVWGGLPPGHGGIPPGHGGIPPGQAGPPGQNNQDDDYDQRLLPWSGVFLELYNPWNGSDTGATPPRELYGANRGVQLNKVTPNGYPVWRMLVMDEVSPGSGNPGMYDNPDESAVSAARGIYFTNTDPANAAALPLLANDPTFVNGRRKYYTTQPIAPILPGQYAMIGTGRGNLPPGVPHPTFVGRRLGATDGDLAGVPPDLMYNETRRVVLTPNIDPTVNQVQVFQGGNDPGYTPPSTPAVAVVINQPSPLSISDPLNGYASHIGASVWDPTAAAGEGAINPPLDPPIDQTANQYWTGVLDHNGTRVGFANVHLQRLANPTADFHPVGNPYRTIDTISIDLTSFNGLTGIDDPESHPNAVNPAIDVNTAEVWFDCRQRGDSEQPADPITNRRRLWPPELVNAAAWSSNTSANEAPTTLHYFDFTLNHTASHTMGSLNHNYIGAGGLTFPWLVWNNRPFVSQYELMQVPRFNSWAMLRQFTLPDGSSPYDGTTAPYGHLANFFHADSTGIPAQHIYRLLEYVHVPSRFVGTETFLNPNYFGKTTYFAQPNGISMGFLPPFNRISTYREPGRVNLNTTTSATVWNALPGNRGPSFNELVNNLWSAVAGVPTLDPNVPTYCEQPWRPASSPLRPHETVLATTPTGIESTLLRNANGIVPPLPLMGDYDTTPRPDLIARHPRNSYFQYEKLHKLGNTVTSRSNVYPIWITVGYFEVEPNWNATSGNVDYDAFHPDGFRVAQEVGIDTGDIRRHRAFYIIDRTIPVAFQPGENHNVDKCVLLRRYIE